MTQQSPSTILADQASVYIESLLAAYRSGALTDIDEISAKTRDVISQFVNFAGEPVFRYNPVIKGEPPVSDKVNESMQGIQHDINILQRQVDFLRASSIYMFNVTATEVQSAKNEQGKIRNKLKTLELYSNDTNPNVVTFAEHFASDDYVDVTKSDTSILSNSFLTLGRNGDLVSLDKTAKVTILDDSNGFSGNPLEVSGTPGSIQSFLCEDMEVSKPDFILDDLPSSWFEYSAYKVSAADKLIANNLGFSYETSITGAKKKWADGPIDSDALVLGLQFELPIAKTMNYISYTPNNTEHPVKIDRVQTSVDGNTWVPVNPPEVWVSTNQNIQSMRATDNLTIGTHSWAFFQRDVKFIKMFIQQYSNTDINLGHIYYTDNKTASRVEGPITPLSNPQKYYGPNSMFTSKMTQNIETFKSKKWSIGIRDVTIQQVKYSKESTFVSKPIRTPGIVDRVSIDADVYVPPEYGDTDYWTEFYVSGDDGVTWNRLSITYDNYIGLPEVVAFNDATPAAFRESGVLYASTTSPVTSIRVKIVLRRPGDSSSSTPIIRSYSLKMRKK